jgi:hypothetical protein
MTESELVSSIGRIVRVRNGKGECEAVLKGHSQIADCWQVSGPDGKPVAVKGERILGLKKTVGAEPAAPAAKTKKMPDATWQLPALAAFIVAVCRRTEVDAWWIGRALSLARSQHKKERDWLRWLREEVKGISKSTAYRYMDICAAFSLEQVEKTPFKVLHSLLKKHDDEPEETADDGDSTDVSGGTEGDNEPDDGDQQQPIVAGKIHSKAPSEADDQDADHKAEDNPETPDEPQPPLTATEIDALSSFIEAVGGLTRAEHVFREGIKQLKELKDET